MAKKTVASWAIGGIFLLVSGCSSSKTPTSTGDAGTGEGGIVKEPTPTGWRAAVGAGGAFVQTFDEQTWETRTLGARDLEAVACVGNLVGWATGVEGIVRHTEDGGRTWRPQDPGLARPLHAIRFGNLALGIVAGDAGALAITRNEGETWSAIATAPPSTRALRSVAIAESARLAIVVGDGGTLLRSIDDAATFQVMAGLPNEDLQAVTVDPGGHLILTVSTSGGIWRSTDRGASFQREMTAPRALHGVALRHDGMRAIAAGDDGLVLQRSEGGAWSSVASGTHETLRAALIPHHGSTSEYVAGTRGTLLALPEGAAHLVPIASGTTADLLALEDL